MILIISQSELDMPSDLVYNWLTYSGADCKRLNGLDTLQHESSIRITKAPSTNKGNWTSTSIDLEKVSAVWIRRWIQVDYFRRLEEQLTDKAISDLLAKPVSANGRSKNPWDGIASPEDDGREPAGFSYLRQEIISQRRSEFKGFSHYLFELLGKKPTLGSRFYSSDHHSKATQMRVAQDCGFLTPDTLITNSKEELRTFATQYPGIVSKNINEVAAFFYSKQFFITYTSIVTKEIIDKLPERFFLSIFQENIEKEFEIRIFYLDKKLYSMAIFSAGDPQTNVDFRVYNGKKPNRTVPFKLPGEVETKVIAFMEAMGLVTGSLDLIYSKSGEYVFLEVNPVGQFGMVSAPCNYRLERLVARYLLKISTHE